MDRETDRQTNKQKTNVNCYLYEGNKGQENPEFGATKGKTDA
jgi:hypothetical protein